MYGLPTATELERRVQLSKESIIKRFELNGREKERFDDSVHKILITHELSQKTTNLPAGKQIQAIYLIEIQLRDNGFDRIVIAILEQMKQSAVYLLKAGDKCKLVMFEKKLFESDWVPTEEISLSIKGFDLDEAWDNLLRSIGNLDETVPLEEQIEKQVHNDKIQRQIDSLKKKIAKEKQSHKISEYYDEILKLEEQLRD